MTLHHLDRVKRIWYLSPMRAAKVQASLRIRAVSPEPSLLAHTSSESRGTVTQKARSVAPLNVWACAVKICHGRMLEDTNSLDGAHLTILFHVLKFEHPHLTYTDPFVPSVPFLGPRQTVQTHVCLQEFLHEIKMKNKIHQTPLKLEIDSSNI